MINIFILIIVSILFVYGLKRVFFFKILKKIGEEVFNGFQILFDKSLSDLQKEGLLKKKSKKIVIEILNFFLKLILLLLPISVIIFLFDSLNFVNKNIIIETLFSIEYLIAFSIVLFISASLKKDEYIDSLDRFSFGDKFIHYLAFSSPKVMKFFFNLEELFIKDKIKCNKHKMVFITTLARGGSTALLNAINKSSFISCHLYRDMPFLTMPNLWNFISRGKKRSVKKIDRAHRDGHKIDLDSPEAFEEVLWKIYWPEKYNKEKIDFIDESSQNDNFKIFFTNHTKKIIQVRNENNEKLISKNLYYCSKNNNNFTRISFLKKIYPESIILIPIREPLSHANSLLNQHINFSLIQKKNKFILNYMSDIGHYEFGLNHKPLNFRKFNLNNYKQNDINYWLEYWICSHEHIIENKLNCHIISLDDLVNSPNSSMEIIFKKIGLSKPDVDFSSFFKKSKKNFDKNTFDRDLYDRALRIYSVIIDLKIT